jgi:hypothetical protein
MLMPGISREFYGFSDERRTSQIDERISAAWCHNVVVGMSSALESDIEQQEGPKYAHGDGKTAYRRG